MVNSENYLENPIFPGSAAYHVFHHFSIVNWDTTMNGIWKGTSFETRFVLALFSKMCGILQSINYVYLSNCRNQLLPEESIPEKRKKNIIEQIENKQLKIK